MRELEPFAGVHEITICPSSLPALAESRVARLSSACAGGGVAGGFVGVIVGVLVGVVVDVTVGVVVGVPVEVGVMVAVGVVMGVGVGGSPPDFTVCHHCSPDSGSMALYRPADVTAETVRSYSVAGCSRVTVYESAVAERVLMASSSILPAILHRTLWLVTEMPEARCPVGGSHEMCISPSPPVVATRLVGRLILPDGVGSGEGVGVNVAIGSGVGVWVGVAVGVAVGVGVGDGVGVSTGVAVGIGVGVGAGVGVGDGVGVSVGVEVGVEVGTKVAVGVCV